MIFQFYAHLLESNKNRNKVSIEKSSFAHREQLNRTSDYLHFLRRLGDYYLSSLAIKFQNIYSFMELDLEAKEEFEQKFRVISLLGKGSFGFVYECEDKVDNQTYAVKVSIF